MNKYVLGIDGMMCGMCEIHVEDIIRKNMSIKCAKASHIKNNVVVISEEDFNQDDFETIIKPTGYRITSFEKGFAVKKLFGWK